jgi:4'-phosphopantetheinyl transferase
MEEERQLLGSIKDDRHRLTTFYQIWGLKESYIKAIGKGLALDLDQFCILPSPPNSVGSTSTKVRRLGLRARRANGDDDDQVGNWCIHLDYLDSKSISVVCCGSRKGGSILDKDLVELGGTTMNLGDMYNGQPSIFTRLDLTTLLS